MDGLGKVAGVLTNWKAIAGFVSAIAMLSGGATAWAVTKLNSKADTAVTDLHRDKLSNIEGKLDTNSEEHRSIHAELTEVRTDTRETRKMIFEMFQAGQRSGAWGTPTLPSPPTIAQRGAP